MYRKYGVSDNESGVSLEVERGPIKGQATLAVAMNIICTTKLITYGAKHRLYIIKCTRIQAYYHLTAISLYI